MWWATAAALLIAIVLVARSIPPAGPEIIIQFADGHGLKVGDFIRHRGIDVGQVESIQLTDDLAAIEVIATLNHGADAVARDGSLFWIVRPQISLTEVRGLETAVGAKYIAVDPGPVNGAEKFRFEGLPSPPPGDAHREGMEIVLRGEDAFGLSTGAPVAWRGVDVGQVLSVDLANDTRYVDVRVHVDQRYRNLVRRNSKFWVVSGLGIDAGFTGFTVKAESLTTIARGGVAFITPVDESNNQPVPPGHVFTLHDEESPEWTKEASTVSLVDFKLPPTIIVQAKWKVKQFGFTRNRQRDTRGLLLADGEGKLRVLVPAQGVEQPEAALDGSWELSLLANGVERPLAEIGENDRFAIANGVATGTVTSERARRFSIPADSCRVPTQPEDCCLVRTADGDEGPTSVIHSLSRTQLTPDGNWWLIDSEGDNLEDWQGAAVVATGNGSTIGLLLTTEAGPAIAPLVPNEKR